MSTTATVHSNHRNELSLRRRQPSASVNPRLDGDADGHEGLQSGWDKLYRARAILEAEQAYLRDDRITLQAEAEALLQRELSISVREEQMRQLELQASTAVSEAAAQPGDDSALTRLTRAPFDLARSVFGHRK